MSVLVGDSWSLDCERGMFCHISSVINGKNGCEIFRILSSVEIRVALIDCFVGSFLSESCRSIFDSSRTVSYTHLTLPTKVTV